MKILNSIELSKIKGGSVWLALMLIVMAAGVIRMLFE